MIVFTPEISEQLSFYVYRLIDPRNGETFYVGKGKANRVFEHASGTLETNEDDASEKLKRVRDIIASGFSVAHVIHRHGLDSKTAFEVEAALIDAYPGITNIAGGHYSGERGAMHARQIIEKFKAETAIFHHNGIAITINNSITEKSIYNAVRYAWKLDRRKAEKAELVFAVQKGLIVGVFKPETWMDATPVNFPNTEFARDGRIGFSGSKAAEKICNQYIRKKLPSHYRKRGAANPVRYISKEI